MEELGSPPLVCRVWAWYGLHETDTLKTAMNVQKQKKEKKSNSISKISQILIVNPLFKDNNFETKENFLHRM